MGIAERNRRRRFAPWALVHEGPWSSTISPREKPARVTPNHLADRGAGGGLERQLAKEYVCRPMPVHGTAVRDRVQCGERPRGKGWSVPPGSGYWCRVRCARFRVAQSVRQAIVSHETSCGSASQKSWKPRRSITLARSAISLGRSIGRSVMPNFIVARSQRKLRRRGSEFRCGTAAIRRCPGVNPQQRRRHGRACISKRSSPCRRSPSNEISQTLLSAESRAHHRHRPTHAGGPLACQIGKVSGNRQLNVVRPPRFFGDIVGAIVAP